jgi:hypothetical protein
LKQEKNKKSMASRLNGLRWQESGIQNLIYDNMHNFEQEFNWDRGSLFSTPLTFWQKQTKTEVIPIFDQIQS